MAQCDMCGKHTTLFNTLVEGTSMNTCKQCSSFGTAVKKPRAYAHQTTRYRPPESVPLRDAAIKIRQTREQHNLTQSEFAKRIGERESIIPKIESGAIVSLAVLQKIERQFSVKLTEQDEVQEYTGSNKTRATFTLGDFIKVKK